MVVFSILVPFFIFGYVVYTLDKNKVCLAIYSPIMAQNIFTGEKKIFSNSCEVPLWWSKKYREVPKEPVPVI